MLFTFKVMLFLFRFYWVNKIMFKYLKTYAKPPENNLISGMVSDKTQKSSLRGLQLNIILHRFGMTAFSRTTPAELYENTAALNCPELSAVRKA